MFRPVEGSIHFPKLEVEIGEFWKQNGIFDKSLAQREGAPQFVFYEGPPTANGLPHPGHCLTRAIKDLFPRYRTMRGYRCDRKAGWDTHGLPVEVEVCKELGIHSKEEIEAYGVEKFIHKCLESVFRYTQQWERLTERLGFWIHLEDAYVTYHQSYVESAWWALKNLFDRNLLYQGHKIVWWWAQGGTALSAGEVGQGYREVADPSVYVRFRVVQDDMATRLGLIDECDLLVWTTTPWTLPSNQYAAVNPNLEYSLIVEPEIPNATLIVATELAATIVAKAARDDAVAYVEKRRFKGSELIGLRYVPPFRNYYDRRESDEVETLAEATGTLLSGDAEHLYWRVVPAEFVTIDSGTGVVHQAPAFGEVDYEVLLAEQARYHALEAPQLLCAVGPDGKFTSDAPEYQGRWVKEADKDIARNLRQRGLLFHQEQYLHEYPFCWRAEQDPLIQYPRMSWFIRTSQFKDRMLANNEEINWLPEHIKQGRFGKFLETNVDWALSRERYWGTPLPIWVCEETGYAEAVGSYDELLAKPGLSGTEAWTKAKQANPKLSDHLKVHKPYIDEVTYDSPQAPGKRMRRVSEVIDAWFDSGSMPFAQWGYPHADGSGEKFNRYFPADFISEALDQTRGWFYSQLAISTLLFSEDNAETKTPHSPLTTHHSPLTPYFPYPHPFRNCIVLGLMLGEDGQKMSKSKRNYREPNEIFDRYGADALRWYFFANQPPWTSIRYSEQAIKDSIPEFLLRLWNVYSFLVIYANIDGFDPAKQLTGQVGQLTPEVLANAEGYRPVAERGELDRWIASELNRTAAKVTERMDAYDNFTACGHITAFVDALSNWYVRRSRDRFWSSEHDQAKSDAYWTLYECLIATSKLIAPFVPFLAEAMWQNLARGLFGDRAAESVHLCDFPTGDAAAIDEALSQRMALVRDIVSLGRAARMEAKLKVRQPLAKVEVILTDRTHQAWLAEHNALICEELNVKEVEFPAQADQYIAYTVLPDLKRLGPKLGKQLPQLRKALGEQDAAALLAEMKRAGQVTLQLPDGPVSLDSDDLQVRLQAKPGWAAAQGNSAVVILSTEITPELAAEGLARELVHSVQTRRKDLDCQYTDRIAVGVETASVELAAAVKQFDAYIQTETLATSIALSPLPGAEGVSVKYGSHEATLYVAIQPRAS
jgi:isoleucyl-tRNA synthetase